MHDFERGIYRQGFRFIAGIDEAGRGPLAGPVVAAAVILPPNYKNPEIADSKRLAPNKREKLYEIIKAEAISFGIGVVEAHIIDKINILRASLKAMEEAVKELNPSPDYLLIDGLNSLPLPYPQKTIVKGDSLSISIAAASIIAKVSRDRIMEIYHRQFSQYNFRKNKGYPTAEHREALKKYGPCKLHRLSFNLEGKIKRRESYFFFEDDYAQG